MKLSNLKTRINKLVTKQKKGKKVKASKIRDVLEGLNKKQNKFEKDYHKKTSTTEKEMLTLQLKVVKAQIKKARRLLKELES